MIMLAPGELTGLMTRLSFLSVAVWWLVFSLPILRVVPEPPRRILPGEENLNPFTASAKRLTKTFREITRFRNLFLFLLAFWFYNDGIGTIIKMATIYGAEIGIGQVDLIGTLLMVQFVAIPFAFLFGWLANRIGTKPAIIHRLLSISASPSPPTLSACPGISGRWDCRGNRSGRQPGAQPQPVREHGS